METPLKLLLIEDSPADEKLLMRELKRGGFDAHIQRVETAQGMTDALQCGGWDLIISDFRLPSFSGPEALSILKGTGLDLPFIIVSGTIGEVNAVDTMRAGASDYVMKNNLARLIPAIHRELADARVRAERRQAEAALHESEARFRIMADSAPVLLWMSDSNGAITYVNKQWLNFTGRSLKDEITGLRSDLIHHDDVAQTLDAYARAKASRKGFQVEYRMRRADGQWRWMLDTGAPRYRTNSVFAGYIGTCIDLTERKQAEAENYRLLQEREQIAIQQKTFVRDVLYSVSEGKLRVCDTKDGLPGEMEPASDLIMLSATSGLRDLRYAARDTMVKLEFPDNRAYDLETAIGEAGMNAIVHAGGGQGRIYTDRRDTVQVWIVDHGLGIDVEALPRATLQKGYTTAGSFGHGMKMMLGLVDRLWLLTQPTGTTVVLEQDHTSAPPIWA